MLKLINIPPHRLVEGDYVGFVPMEFEAGDEPVSVLGKVVGHRAGKLLVRHLHGGGHFTIDGEGNGTYFRNKIQLVYSGSMPDHAVEDGYNEMFNWLRQIFDLYASQSRVNY